MFLVVKWVLQVYSRILSPFLHALAGPGMGCRFYPSCSRYSHEAVSRHGLGQGIFLGAKRLLKCHPVRWLGGSAGFDPVPEYVKLKRESE